MIRSILGARLVAAGALGAGLVAPATTLAQIDPAPVNTGAVTWSIGLDVVSEYWFRGTAQENQGLILQPYSDVTFSLISQGNVTLDLYAGTWNSIHSEVDEEWYEADFFGGAVIGLPAGFSLDISYVNFYGPAAGGSYAEEIDVALSWDDSPFWADRGIEGFALNPYVLFAYEIDAGSDALGGDGDEGSYLEFGISPSFNLTQGGDYPLTLTVPMTVGFGVSDYYETGINDDGDDFVFGFFDVGAVVSVPLPFIPADYGAWHASAGVHYIILGDEAQDISGPEGFNVIGSDQDDSFYVTFGLSMTY